MSGSKRLEGRLTYGRESRLENHEGDPVEVVGPVELYRAEGDEERVATVDEPDALAVAERLVACWNACEGIENPEEMVPLISEQAVAFKRLYETMQGKHVEAISDIANLRKQQDELLEALREAHEVLAANGGFELGAIVNYSAPESERRTLGDMIDAAIAKAEGRGEDQ